jgi:hypothetical protein
VRAVGSRHVDRAVAEPLCAAVLARLFPDAPDGDPVQVLLWATGRTEFDDRPRVTSWVMKAAID